MYSIEHIVTKNHILILSCICYTQTGQSEETCGDRGKDCF